PGLRVFSILLGDNPVLEESARLYDRLLTGHAFAFDEAAALAEGGERAADEIVGYYDRQAVPVLAMAQADHDAGLLTDRQAQSIAHAVFDLTERLEPVIEDEASEEEALPGAGCRVAVIGARTLLDDAAAELLAQAMRANGAATLVLPH